LSKKVWTERQNRRVKKTPSGNVSPIWGEVFTVPIKIKIIARWVILPI